jgi:hypothetical protein
VRVTCRLRAGETVPAGVTGRERFGQPTKESLAFGQIMPDVRTGSVSPCPNLYGNFTALEERHPKSCVRDWERAVPDSFPNSRT